MKRALVIGTGIFFTFWSSLGTAYAPGTHQRLSEDAAEASVLMTVFPGQTTILQDLGLGVYLGPTTFPDSQKNLNVDLALHDDDFKTDEKDQPIFELIRIGAALEDHDARGVCHFYDPKNSIHPLNSDLFGHHQATYDALDWGTIATDSDGICTYSGIGDEKQAYSIKSAEDYFYNALTQPAKSARDKAFGNLFLSIGHTLHLLEDMGQPQHVRNDAHCDDYACIALLKYTPSKYEVYAHDQYNFDHAGKSNGSTPSSTIYDAPAFDDVRSYWSNSDGKGLADYTNRNFLSAGTLDSVNGRGIGYDSPQLDKDYVTSTDVTALYNNYFQQSVPAEIDYFCRNRPTGTCLVSFLATTLDDKVNSNSPTINLYAAGESFFKEDLTDEGAHQIYTLNRMTEKRAWEILYPEIVSYGAGLVNHFFRGKLDVGVSALDPAHPDMLNYRVTNLSNYALTDGRLEVYYDSTDSQTQEVMRYQVPDVAIDHFSLEANCGAFSSCTDSIVVSLPSPSTLGHVPTKPGKYTFVYKGNIGSEEGVASKVFDPDPALYLMLDVIDGQSHGYDSMLTLDPNGVPDNFTSLGGEECPLHSGVPFCPNQYLGIYKGIEYVTYPGGVRLTTNPSSAPVIRYPDSATGCGTSVGGVAANSQGIYVIYAASSSCPFEGTLIDRYDFNFVKQQTTQLQASNSSFNDSYYGDYLGNLSVNEARICAIPRDNTFAHAYAELLDLNGNRIAILLPASDDTVPISCASTGDRQYLTYLVISTAQMHLSVFDNDGNRVQDMVVGVGGYGQPDGAMSATDTAIYLSESVNPTSNVPKPIMVLKRTVVRNFDKTIASETFTRGPDILASAFLGKIQRMTVDTYTIMNGLTQ